MEALVVLGILMIAASLLLPAVQAARQQASQLQCSSRLAQLGTALAAFEESHKRLPRAFCGVVERNKTLFPYCLSPFVELLPYVGER